MISYRMLLCEVTCSPRGTSLDERDRLTDAVQRLFGALCKNGQVWGEEIWGWVHGKLRVVCWVPRLDALERCHHSPWVQSAMLELEKQCAFAYNVVDDRAAARSETRHEGRGLYLYTHMFDRTSPVCAGQDGEPVPLYLLGDLVAWMANYQEMDRLQIGCGVLELPAYKELARPDSALAEHGRALARQVEAATNLPTYYYLMRYWGRGDVAGQAGNRERKRRCPGCGEPWAVERESERGMGWFDFRCDPCRLVSHLGVSFDNERHARIGEWRGR